MKQNHKVLIGAIAFIGLFIIVVLVFKSKLQIKGVITTGVIRSCYWGGRGTSAYIVEADFYVNNKSYSSSCQLSCSDLEIDSLKKYLINLRVPVIYLPKSPIINFLLVESKTYKIYNVSMPDSLLWLNEFLKCK